MTTKKVPSKRNCKGCGTPIEHKHKNAKFCTIRCKDDYWNYYNPRGYDENDRYHVDPEGQGWDAHKD